MSYKIIPLTPAPNQTLTCTIPVGSKNITLMLNFRYNTIGEYWYMAILDANTKDVILDNIPLLTGGYPASDILSQYSYLGLGSAVIIKANNVLGDYPDDTNLGSDFLLIWGDTNEQ